MRFTYLVLATVSPLIYVSAPFLSYAHPGLLNSSEIIIAQQSSKDSILSGKFVGVEKPASGSAKIISDGGSHYLVFDSSFSTSNQGPDLHVLLDIAAKPSKNYKNLGKTVNLGKLKSFSGVQRYVIPDVINVAQFKSVVIWCRTANATFAYASLK